MIIGGGVAGFALAHALQRRGVQNIVVVERETLPFTHASSHNAAIFRPLEHSEVITGLAARNFALIQQLDHRILTPNGLFLVARARDTLAPLVDCALGQRVMHQLVSGQELYELAPLLEGGSARFGIWLPQGGTLDPHLLCEGLRAQLLGHGTRVMTASEALSISTSQGRVTGVQLSSEHIPAERAIIAGGAWACAPTEHTTYRLALLPHRRHLAQLQPPLAIEPTHPICWEVDTDVYFRPESRGVLACPGDHDVHPAAVPNVDPARLGQLAERLPRLAPKLLTSTVRHAWACLRTMSPDGHMALGADPRLPGLHWFAGLAGHGMSTALAAAELLADHLVHGANLPGRLQAARLLATPATEPAQPNPPREQVAVQPHEL